MAMGRVSKVLCFRAFLRGIAFRGSLTTGVHDMFERCDEGVSSSSAVIRLGSDSYAGQRVVLIGRGPERG